MMNIGGEVTPKNDPHSSPHKRNDAENPLQSPYIQIVGEHNASSHFVEEINPAFDDYISV